MAKVHGGVIILTRCVVTEVVEGSVAGEEHKVEGGTIKLAIFKCLKG